MRRAIKVALGAVIAAGVLLLFALPVRTLLSQNQSLAATRFRIQLLSRENQTLTTEAAQLKNTTYIEEVAREQYGLVLPGEQAYVILPPVARR